MVYGVITGDVVQSREMTISQRQDLYKSLKKELKRLDKEFNARSEMYRGDSFQCLVCEPKNTLRLALLIKTFIRSLNPKEKVTVTPSNKLEEPENMVKTKWMFDARLALGMGGVELMMPKVGASDGEAFWLSGMLLDEMKDTRQTIAIETKDEHSEELETEVYLLDSILARTSALQCEVIYYKLLGETEVEISKNLKILQSSVNQRSTAGNWNAIDKMVFRFEQIYGKR